MYLKQTLVRLYIVVNLVFSIYSDSNETAGNVKIIFDQEPEDLVVLPGTEITLNCSARSNREHVQLKVEWYKDGYPMINSLQYEILPNNSLHIETFNSSNVGEYLCVAKLKRISRLSRPAKVVIASIRATAKDRSIQHVSVTEGCNMLINCHIIGTPNVDVLWLKNSSPLISDNKKIIPVASKSLHVMNVTKDDEGTYQCVASNVAGRLTGSAVEVEVKSKTTEKHEKIQLISSSTKGGITLFALKGEKAVLTCLWSCGESVWYKDKLMLNKSSETPSSMLLLTNVSSIDSGTYICRNSLRKKPSSTIHFTVHSPPELTIPLENDVDLFEDVSELTCEFIGRPRPRVTWFKNGEKEKDEEILFGEVKNTDDRKNQLHDKVHYSTLRYKQMTAGVYQCMVFNRAGFALATFDVSKPRQLGPPTNLVAQPALDGEIQLTWEPPKVVRGVKISGYAIYYWSDIGGEAKRESQNTQSTNVTIEKMSPFTNYTFYVVAVSNIGWSKASDKVMQRTNEGVPRSAPQVALRALNSTTIFVDWKKLTHEQSNGIISENRVFLQLHEKDSTRKIFKLPGTATNYTISGLTPKMAYDVKVLSGTEKGFPDLRARNWETIFLKEEDENQLYHPEDVKIEVIGSTKVRLTWEVRRTSDDIMFFCFKVKYLTLNLTQGVRSKTVVTSEEDRSVVLLDLVPNTAYQLQITPVSDLGDGEPVTLFFATPVHDDALPRKPSVKISCKTSNFSTIMLSMAIADNQDASLATVADICYGVYISRENPNCEHHDTINIQRNLTEVPINDLQPMTEYFFFFDNYGVRTYNISMVLCTTDIPAPQSVNFTQVGDNLNVTWNLPEGSAGVTDKGEFHFKVFFTDDKNVPLSNWSTRIVGGSRFYEIIEDVAESRRMHVLVCSMFGSVESTKVEAIYIDTPIKGDVETTTSVDSSTSVVVVCVTTATMLTLAVIFFFFILMRRRKLKQKERQKLDCLDSSGGKVTTTTALKPSIKPFQSNNSSVTSTACNGDRHHYYNQGDHRYQGDQNPCTADPLLLVRRGSSFTTTQEVCTLEESVV